MTEAHGKLIPFREAHEAMRKATNERAISEIIKMLRTPNDLFEPPIQYKSRRGLGQMKNKNKHASKPNNKVMNLKEFTKGMYNNGDVANAIIEILQTTTKPLVNACRRPMAEEP